MRTWLLAALFLIPASHAQADCPNIFTAKSGLPGHVGDWTTTYDMRAGTFRSRHVSGNTISGNMRRVFQSSSATQLISVFSYTN
jgi:hypothetical protein